MKKVMVEQLDAENDFLLKKMAKSVAKNLLRNKPSKERRSEQMAEAFIIKKSFGTISLFFCFIKISLV
jgi:hypothetical protein